jgi:hypothetical protein
MSYGQLFFVHFILYKQETPIGVFASQQRGLRYLILYAAFMSSSLSGKAFYCHKDTKAQRTTKFSLKYI